MIHIKKLIMLWRIDGDLIQTIKVRCDNTIRTVLNTLVCLYAFYI